VTIFYMHNKFKGIKFKYVCDFKSGIYAYGKAHVKGPFMFFFPLALQPNSGLGRLHETFSFTSVTRSRIVGRTPWTGD
jgi:hypothetical protein